MRFGASFCASLPGRDDAASNATPCVRARSCSIALVPCVDAIQNVPAGYVLPFAVTGERRRYTSAPLLSARFTATNALFIAWLTRKPLALGTVATLAGGTVASPVISFALG